LTRLFKRFGGKKIFRKRVFVRLLLSYAAILLIPLTIYSLLYARVEEEMVNNSSNAYLGMLEQVKQVVDNQMRELDSMTLQIALNPKLQYLLNMSNESNRQDHYKFIELIRDLDLIRNSKRWAYDFYIHFNSSKQVLSPERKTDAATFFGQIVTSPNDNYRKLIEGALAQYNYKTFYPSLPLLNGATVTNTITYVQSLPIGDKDVKGALVVHIDELRIHELLQTIEKVDQAQIFIVNAKGQLILSTAGQQQLPIRQDELIADGEGASATAEYGNRIISYTTSLENGWKYISVLPKEVVMQSVLEMKKWAFLLLLICLIVGGIVCYAMAHRTYNPIRQVMKTLLTGNTQADSNMVDEFDFIQKTLAGSMTEAGNLREKISRQMPVIQANFLSRLIKGNVEAAAVTEETLAEIGIRFRSDRFAVVLIDIDTAIRNEENMEHEWAFISFIVINLSKDLMKDNGYVLEMERQRLAVLLCLSEKSDENEIAVLIQRLDEILTKRFMMQITWGVSDVVIGLRHIAEAYRQSLMAIDFKIMNNPNSVIYYKDTRGLEQTKYHYPIELEQQLINYAKDGDADRVDGLLEQIYETNFISHPITPEMSKCLFYDMVGTLLKLSNAPQVMNGMQQHGQFDPIKTILDCTTVNEMLLKTKECFFLICKYMKENVTDRSERLYGKARKYMDSFYDNSNFNLVEMAEHLDLTPKYLSSFYKKYSGRNIMDDVALIRINEAKRLLEEQKSLTISQIAQRVGYTNDAALIRVFKKLEGITPGVYRELLNQLNTNA